MLCWLSRVGLYFPVGSVHRLLRKENYADHVGARAPVYVVGVHEQCLQPFSLPRQFVYIYTIPGTPKILVAPKTKVNTPIVR